MGSDFSFSSKLLNVSTWWGRIGFKCLHQLGEQESTRGKHRSLDEAHDVFVVEIVQCSLWYSGEDDERQSLSAAPKGVYIRLANQSLTSFTKRISQTCFLKT